LFCPRVESHGISVVSCKAHGHILTNACIKWKRDKIRDGRKKAKKNEEGDNGCSVGSVCRRFTNGEC
jgi:hypothetical protein